MPTPSHLAYIGILVCVVSMLPQFVAAAFYSEQQLLVPTVIFVTGQIMGTMLCLPQIFCAARHDT